MELNFYTGKFNFRQGLDASQEVVQALLRARTRWAPPFTPADDSYEPWSSFLDTDAEPILTAAVAAHDFSMAPKVVPEEWRQIVTLPGAARCPSSGHKKRSRVAEKGAGVRGSPSKSARTSGVSDWMEKLKGLKNDGKVGARGSKAAEVEARRHAEADPGDDDSLDLSGSGSSPGGESDSEEV